MEPATGTRPLRFKEQHRALVSLRLTLQAKQALTEANTSGLSCSMRFAPDGVGPQVQSGY